MMNVFASGNNCGGQTEPCNTGNTLTHNQKQQEMKKSSKRIINREIGRAHV